jgi:hypothetical protein
MSSIDFHQITIRPQKNILGGGQDQLQQEDMLRVEDYDGNAIVRITPTGAIIGLAGTGDMTRSVYDTDLDGKVDAAEVADQATVADAVTLPVSALTGTSPALVFAAPEKVHLHSLSGNTTYTASGYAAGRRMRLILTGDGSQRTMTLPAGWVPIEGALATVPANKKVVVEIFCTDATEAGVVYWWGAQQ